MYNTIRLLRGEKRLSYSEFKKFQRGDTIFGVDSDPTEIKRWSIDDKDKAKAELSKYQCSCSRGICIYDVEEYGLEYCKCDENGEFVSGSDYTLAEEGENKLVQ